LRAYFLPVMVGDLIFITNKLVQGSASYVMAEIGSATWLHDEKIFQLLLVVYFFFQSVDVVFAILGYLLAFRALDTDIRSVEPTFFGCAVCLVCYSPFWDSLIIPSLLYDFYSNPQWQVWLAKTPLLGAVWGSLAVIAMCSESLGTLTFGMRFSNLTYRGLITTGQFRFTKHPQYISKIFNRFLVFMPFLSHAGVWGACRTVVLFTVIPLIYFLRARTEENHLSRYPEYVQYALWIDQNGLFRFVNKWLPFVRYDEASAKAGRLFRREKISA
jgi:isoprenylcysteine carboxyl methyltransferase (ICMT) family protein YpbQ